MNEDDDLVGISIALTLFGSGFILYLLIFQLDTILRGFNLLFGGN